MSASSRKRCKSCRKIVIVGQPDPCLGYLPGIAHACCGHGATNRAYCCGFDRCRPNEPIMTDGFYRKGYWVKRGLEALEYMRSLKNK
jgi:hypothetical protein